VESNSFFNPKEFGKQVGLYNQLGDGEKGYLVHRKGNFWYRQLGVCITIPGIFSWGNVH
jgi:hypothetical protein